MSEADGSQSEIDLRKLERELVRAVEADRKYSRENDAKFRAVNQKVASYEEFRDIVKASHLSPLDRKDITDSTRKQPWNPVAHGNPPASVSDCDRGSSTVEGVGLPGNVQEFIREWRRLKPRPLKERYGYIVFIGGERLLELFRVEISMGLLGEMLTALNEGWREEDGSQVLSVLSHLSKTSRFSLSLDFLSSTEKQSTCELMRKLLDWSSSQPVEESSLDRTASISTLARMYAVETH